MPPPPGLKRSRAVHRGLNLLRKQVMPTLTLNATQALPYTQKHFAGHL